MKTKNLFIFTWCVIFFNAVNYKSEAVNYKNNQVKEIYSEGQIINMLKKFYTSYITEYSKITGAENTTLIVAKLDSIKKTYCTTKLLNKIEKEELDEDPFLKSQDFDIKWLKKLTFRKNSKRQNLYIVSYSFYDQYNHANIQITINLIIVKLKGYYKIDAVL